MSLRTVFLALSLLVFASILVEGLKEKSKVPEKGCVGFGVCCRGKNISCVGSGPSQNNKTGETCFCDEDCLRLGDCCLDYRFTCKPVNCLLSERWTEWSKCDQSCGTGAQHRMRPVIVHPRNGGKKCEPHIERRMCEGVNCEPVPATEYKPRGHNETRKVDETANIVPAIYASWRTNVLYNPLQDIRQSLFLNQIKYATLLKEKKPTYCATFQVTETRGACQLGHSEVSSNPKSKPPSTKSLIVGNTVCVECQPFGILQRTRSARCIGDGVYKMETSWNAVTAPRCHGKWVMTSKHQIPCQCDPSSEASFIFI